MKKFTAILLAVLMMISCLSIMAVSAAETATITVNGTKYTVDVGKTLTYTVNLKTVHALTNCQVFLSYPQSILTVSDYDFPVVGKGNVVANYNENVPNEFRFSFSNQAEPYDFTNGGVLVTIDFAVTAAGSGSIGFINETESTTVPGLIRETEMSWIDTSNGYCITSELPNATLTEKLTGYNAPVTPTTISVTAAKKAIKVNGTTTVKATVTNGVGKTTFKSSNTKIATVTSAGKVTGKGAGTVTITATNNGKSNSVKITVSKNAQTMTVKAAAKTLKYATVKKKAQTFKPITVKNAKGTVTYAKKSGNSKITVNKKTGAFTVKKGTAKGKYSIKVNVTAAGNTAYNKGTKTVTVKVSIK